MLRRQSFVPPPLRDFESNPNSSDAENVLPFLIGSRFCRVHRGYRNDSDKRREDERFLQEKGNTNTALKENDESDDSRNAVDVAVALEHSGIAKRCKARLASKENKLNLVACCFQF